MDDKFEEMIEKQVEREDAMKKAKEEYINETKIPRKQITVKIFPNTHKKLKLIAASKDITIEKVATSIIEDNIREIDIAKYVKEIFKKANEFEEESIEDYESSEFGWLKKMDADNSTYDLNDKILKKGMPRKRINVKVDYETHRKLRVISAIQDRSLDKIVGSIIEYEVGEENKINTSKLLEELLLVLMLN